MPDTFDGNGLSIKTLPEIVSDLITGMQGIYGTDINVDQNSPDGQLLNIIGQACVDIRELIAQVNAGFDPDQAIGVTLDQRVTINNIQRIGGTFTIVPITIITSGTVELAGLDAAANDINGTGYTAQDGSGNEYILLDSATLTPGTIVKDFRAKNIGQVEPTLHTINTPVTIVIGVTSVDNVSAPLSIGQNEETDAQLRLRRQRSVALSSNGYLNGLLGKVLNLAGVINAVLYENVGDTTDGDGIPGHGIWLVVSGGANSDIGELIYENKSYGANMKGSVTVDITTPSGLVFIAKFDRPTAQNLFIRFTIQSFITGTSFNSAKIKADIVDSVLYTIGEPAETSGITVAALNSLMALGGGGVPVLVEISDDGATWTDFLETPSLDSQWTLDASRITISVVNP